MLGERVHEFRRLKGLTVEALGKASGLSKGFISQVERGHSQPSLQSLARLASALGVSPTSLLTPSEARSSQDPLPRIERASSEGSEVSRLAAVSQIGSATVYHASLAPRASLSWRGLSPQASATALAALSGGEVEFLQAGAREAVAAGDYVVFDAAAAYEFANVSSRSASLVLVLPSHAALPDVSDAAERRGSSESGPARRGTSGAEGPLRLAAMRARHRALKGT